MATRLTLFVPSLTMTTGHIRLSRTYIINIAVNGQPTRVDAIFVKGIDIEGHSAEPMGGTGVGYSNRMMPATIQIGRAQMFLRLSTASSMTCTC